MFSPGNLEDLELFVADLLLEPQVRYIKVPDAPETSPAQYAKRCGGIGKDLCAEFNAEISSYCSHPQSLRRPLRYSVQFRLC